MEWEKTLLKTFEWKEPTSQMIEKLATVRERYRELAELLVRHAPPGLRRLEAFKYLEISSMLAAKAITHD